MLDLLFKKLCWTGGFTNSKGLTQSNNIVDIPKTSFEDSNNGSKRRQSREILAAEDKLQDSDVQLRLVVHHGIPTASCLIAYNPLHHGLAIATKDGQIKLLTDEGMESLLQSSEKCAIRFLQFFNDQRLLVCANVENMIEVWHTGTSSLVSLKKWNIDITALAVIQDSTYFFIGDASGAVTVLQYDFQKLEVNVTAYTVSLPQVFGDSLRIYNEEFSVKYILPQPSAEHERVLICYANGVCVLWALHDSEVIAARAHTPSELEAFPGLERQGVSNAAVKHEDVKGFTCVCWSCAKGVMFATGYRDGDIWLWNITQTSKTFVPLDTVGNDNLKYSSTPLCKMNTGLSVPINVLRWWEKGDPKQKKEGFLCALGGKDGVSFNVLKVISVDNACLLKPKSFLELEVPGYLADCMPVESMKWSSLEADVSIIGLGSGGKLFAYDAKEIYKSLSSSVHSEALLLTRPVSIDFSLSKSKVTTTKLILLQNHGQVFDFIMEMPRGFKPCLSYESLELNRSFTGGCKQGEYLTDLGSEGCYVYVTGHEDGSVNFWDVSIQIVSLPGLQMQENRRLQGSPMRNFSVSSLDFCSILGLLGVGYANGLISFHRLNLKNHDLNLAQYSNDGKEGSSVFWSSISKFHTHQAPISCIVISSPFHRVAAGCENGMISLIDIERMTVLYSGSCFRNKFASIISLNFVSVATQHNTFSCFGSPISSRTKSKHIALTGMEILFVTTEESEIFVLDAQSGAPFKSSSLKPKNASTAVSTHVLDVSGTCVVPPAGYQSELLLRTAIFKEPKNVSTPQECEKETAKTTEMTQVTKTLESAMCGEASTVREKATQYLILLCSEDALRLYQVPLSIKGVCSSLIKVKLDSLCHWASTFQAPNKRLGLALIYKSGKLELRSLPSLNLLKAMPPEGFLKCRIERTFSSLNKISSTTNGRIALVKDDGEFLVLAVLDEKHDVRCSKLLPESPKPVKKGTETTASSLAKKKRKKSLGNVLKATNVLLRVSGKGNKGTCQKVVDLDHLFTGKNSSFSVSLQSSLYSNDESHSDCSSFVEMSSATLDIDDIEIEDEDPLKDATITPNQRNLSKVKKNIKGKEKLRKLHSRMVNPQRSECINQNQESDTDLSSVCGPRTIDEIKAAYGQGKEHTVTETAAGLRDKLLQRKHRIQAMDRKTADMQEGAQHFHNMAEELFKVMEAKHRRKFF